MYYLTANYYYEVRIILYLYFLFIHTYIYHLNVEMCSRVNNSISDYLFDAGMLTLQLDSVANSEKVCECNTCKVNAFLCC